MRENKFRKALKREGPIFGGAGTDPQFIEMLGHWGFDYVFLDNEHNPMNVDFTLQDLVRAADSVNLPVVCRLKGLDEHLVRNALEMGIVGVIIPHIRSRQDAEKAVSYARFPPKGIRGSAANTRVSEWGAGKGFNWNEFVKKSNEDVVVIGMGEDKAFFENIDEFLKTDGLSMINYGPTDLATDMGLNVLYDLDAPPIKAALEELTAKGNARNIPVMCPAGSPNIERVRKMIKQGVKAIGLLSASKLYNEACRKSMEEIILPIREQK